MRHEWSGLYQWIARHEAAHAVVAVRLRLPLAATAINDWRASPQKAGTVVEAGYTALATGSLEGWKEQLPNPVGRERLLARALMAAVGCIVASDKGLPGGYEKDVRIMQSIARTLGIGGLTFESAPPVNKAATAWLHQLCEVAETVLLSHDGGAAWDRVTHALERHLLLSGDAVLTLVAQSDAANSQPHWTITANEAWQLPRQRRDCQCEECLARTSNG